MLVPTVNLFLAIPGRSVHRSSALAHGDPQGRSQTRARLILLPIGLPIRNPICDDPVAIAAGFGAPVANLVV